jgi:hypothetical protein
MRPRHAIPIVLITFLLTRALFGDEAQRPDGQRQTGTLSLDRGRLSFTPTDKGATISGDRLALVRFGDSPSPLWRVGGGVRVQFAGGERLTGVLLGLDRDKLRLRAAWADKLSLPRSALRSIAHLSGWRTLIDDNFRDGLKAWRVTGKPELTDGDSGARTVRLIEGGQSVALTIATPVDAGRLGVSFQERDTPSGAKWQVEAQFGADGKERIIRITVAGSGDVYQVEAPDLRGTTHKLPRSAGWHRLTLQFSTRMLAVACDDSLLWHSLDNGPGGSLRQVRLVCVAEDRARPRGAVDWTEFSLAKAVDSPRHPPGDTTQDEIWLAEGDQLFGDIVAADHRGIEIHGRFGKRTLPWSAVRGCYFRQGAGAARAAEGARVRLGLATGLTNDEDLLDGVLTALDEKRLTLRHAILGELSLDRARVRWLRPLVSGAAK